MTDGSLKKPSAFVGSTLGTVVALIEMPDEPGIDWLFISEFASVLAAEVVRNELTTGASDHLPVTATIEF